MDSHSRSFCADDRPALSRLSVAAQVFVFLPRFYLLPIAFPTRIEWGAVSPHSAALDVWVDGIDDLK